MPLMLLWGRLSRTCCATANLDCAGIIDDLLNERANLSILLSMLKFMSFS